MTNSDTHAPQFFPPLEPLSPREIAGALGREVSGDTAAVESPIVGVSPLEAAEAGHLSFLDNPRYAEHLSGSLASCVILGPKFADHAPDHLAVIVSPEPYRDFARAAAMLVPASVNLRGLALTDGVSDGAHIHSDAVLEDGVTVEPGAIVGAGAHIGSGTIVCAGAVVGHDTQIGRGSYVGSGAVVQHALIGDDVIIHSNVNIGQDGFGFAMGPAGHLKVPQLGRVIVQDKVEIGAGTCIDRGTTRDTIVGEGTKIDNQVQLGHNVQIGRHCIIVAQVGIAGSTVVEDFVAIGGQVGIAGHLRVGMGAQIAASSNVKDNVPPGARWAGTPAKPAREVFREMAAVKKLGQNSRGAPKGD